MARRSLKVAEGDEEAREAWVKRYLEPRLNEMWSWWAPRQDYKRSLRNPDGTYSCEGCGDRVSREKLQIDHIAPKVPVTGPLASWDARIKAHLCWSDNMQGLCETCHKAKTKAEAATRAKHRRLKKELEKEDGKVSRDRKKVSAKRKPKLKRVHRNRKKRSNRNRRAA